jgi:hypothetical protein
MPHLHNGYRIPCETPAEASAPCRFSAHPGRRAGPITHRGTARNNQLKTEPLWEVLLLLLL